MADNEFIVRGAYGDIICDATCGHVLRLENTSGSREYGNVTRIDMDELRDWCAKTGDKALEHGETDILNVGLWTDQGVWEEPAPDYRENRASPLNAALREMEDAAEELRKWQVAARDSEAKYCATDKRYEELRLKAGAMMKASTAYTYNGRVYFLDTFARASSLPVADQ
jgi:hypothetical protein